MSRHFRLLCARASHRSLSRANNSRARKKVRNDRLLAVAKPIIRTPIFAGLKDLPKKFLHELEDFFVDYHKLEGTQYRLLGCKGAGTAWKLIKQAQKAA